jgi:hypothetical protein
MWPLLSLPAHEITHFINSVEGEFHPQDFTNLAFKSLKKNKTPCAWTGGMAQAPA